MSAKVYLIGAGPGDVGLLTLKAKQLIENADIVLYDSLVGSEIVAMISAEAEAIYVGKRSGQHSLTQEQINQKLIEQAKKAEHVVRLKGGDSFVFGRGGEEVLALIDAGIDFEVIPGISSALAAPTYSGIPLTHREMARSFHVFTGHFKSGKLSDHFDFSVLAKLKGTLVFLMSIASLGEIVEGLTSNGKASTTPVAMIENGTLPYQRQVIATLADIEEKVLAEQIKSPALVVIGDVVGFAESFYREKQRPLLGKKVIVTRSRVQASELRLELENLGANILECPAIRAVSSELKEKDCNKIKNISIYNWLIFTSANSVKSFFELLLEQGVDYRLLANCKIAVVGTVTRRVLQDYGFIADLIPKSYHSSELYKELLNNLQEGDKILRIRGGFADESLLEKLSADGYDCDELTVYEIAAGEFNRRPEEVETADVITFTSGSTVSYFSAFLEEHKIALMADKPCVCIGPLTAEAAKKAGYNNVIVADKHTIKGVVDKVLENVNS